METYKSLIREAIAALPEHDGAARRAIYEKARAALADQLRSLQPPLQPAEIKRTRLYLEETIHQVEREFSPPPTEPKPEGDGQDADPDETAATPFSLEMSDGNIIEAEYSMIALPAPDLPSALKTSLERHVQQQVSALEALLERDADRHPMLAEAVGQYHALIRSGADPRELADLWSVGGALANLLAAHSGRQASNTSRIAVMPEAPSALQALVWEHGASIMGQSTVNRLMEQAEAFLADRRELAAQLGELYWAAEHALEPQHLLGDAEEVSETPPADPMARTAGTRRLQ